jgi:predicted Zn-dependent peptidase
MSRLRVPVERHRLGNGLKVVLSPDHGVPVVAVNLWYGVGSRNEPEGKTGFAHLFEHMMFQGSAHVPKNGHFEMIERVGGTLNGSTWFDRTNYYETVPSNDLELALWLESDRMGWLLPAMDQAKLDNQRDVVKNEKRQRYDNQPYGDWAERLQALMYPEDHPYHHTVIGSMEDLDAATLEDVEGFFRTFYVPSNAVLAVAGDVDAEEAVEAVRRYFGEIAPGAPTPPIPGRTELEPILGGTVRDHVVSDVPLPRVIMAFRTPTFADDDFPVAEVSNGLLGMGRASRLHRRLVRERRIAKSVMSYQYPLLTGASMLLTWATGYPGSDLDALEAALAEEIQDLRGATQEEVDRAIALAETDLLYELEHVASRADQLSMYELYFGEPELVNTLLDRLRAVTVDQIRAFAERRLGADNRAVIVYEPSSGSDA